VRCGDPSLSAGGSWPRNTAINKYTATHPQMAAHNNTLTRGRSREASQRCSYTWSSNVHAPWRRQECPTWFFAEKCTVITHGHQSPAPSPRCSRHREPHHGAHAKSCSTPTAQNKPEHKTRLVNMRQHAGPTPLAVGGCSTAHAMNDTWPACTSSMQIRSSSAAWWLALCVSSM